MTTYSLIQDLEKESDPNHPYLIDSDGMVRVDATATVPIELSFKGILDYGLIGIDFVFLIDNSGSMRDTNDTGRIRFSAIQVLANHYKATRNQIDQVSIVVFSGDTDGSDTEVWLDWSTWSETEVFIAEYMANSALHPPAAGTYTPMAKGMEKANAQFAGSTKPYKMVIMLSDGRPEPDYYLQQGEIQSDHVPFAKEHDIIYSPILLGAGQDGASGLLDKIAIETDYITNPQTVPPYFSFNSPNVGQIQAKYDAAITRISNRIVPKRVTLIEKVNDILEVVDARLSIDVSNESQNQIDLSTPLANAITQFKDTGKFQVLFKELVGEATLKFSVKLKLDQVPLASLQNDYIEVRINDIAQSSITFDHPQYGTLPPITQAEWPQTIIRFLTGIHVTKELIDPQPGENYSVKITMANMTASPLEWFWIKESPSRDVDISEINDDYEFNPFSLIVSNFMVGRTCSVLRRLYNDELSNVQMGQLFQDAEDYFRDWVLPLGNIFNHYLWRYNIPKAQRGIFKLVRNVPPTGERVLSFKVKGAAFGNPCWISGPVDSPLKKPPHSSRYRYPGVVGWKYLETNPEFSQTVVQGPRPEIGIDTCFDVMFSDMFFEGLVGIDPLTYPNITPPSPYEVLDSPDITPTGLRDSTDPFGLSITVRNRGTGMGLAPVTAGSLYIPLPVPSNPPSQWIRPFRCVYENPQINIGARQDVNTPTELTLQATYDTIVLHDGTQVPVDPNLLSTFSGWVISRVDIGPANGELLLGNNNAIEIKFIAPPKPRPSSLIVRLVEYVRESFDRLPNWPP